MESFLSIKVSGLTCPAYAESEAFQALKAKSEEIIEGGFAGIVIDKAEV